MAVVQHTLLDTLDRFAAHVLTNTPKQDEKNNVRVIDDPRSTPSLLEDDTFAEQIHVGIVPDEIYGSRQEMTPILT